MRTVENSTKDDRKKSQGNEEEKMSWGVSSRAARTETILKRRAIYLTDNIHYSEDWVEVTNLMSKLDTLFYI